MARRKHDNLWGIVLKHGWRNIKRGGLHFFFVSFMIALGLYGLAAFSTVWLNFERLAQRVGSSVGAVVFLETQEEDRAKAIAQSIASNPQVARADLVSPTSAMQRAVGELDSSNALLVDSKDLALPWVIEVTRSRTERASSLDALVKQLQQVDGVAQVMHAGAEVARLERLTEVLMSVGLYLALLIGLITMLVVGNTVKLTVLARSDEVELMKLVGATDGFIRNPFLMEGFAQGSLGGASAALVLFLSHQTLAGVLRESLSDAFGVFELAPLPWLAHFGLVLAGGLLGLLGAAFSLRRYLRV